MSSEFWDDVRAQLAASPAGARVVVARGDAPAPAEAGALRDLGLPVGQLADWRFPPGDDCTGLHVHEFADRWEAHLDQVHPACSLVGHVRADAPQLLVGAGLLAGAAIGSRKGSGGALIGALIGAALGAALSD